METVNMTETPTAPQETATPAVADDNVSAGGVHYTDAQKAQTAQTLKDLEVPSFLQYWYYRFDYDRRYVSDESLLLDSKNTVSVNYVYRNTQILAASLLAKDPQVSVRQRTVVGQPPPLLDEFAKTCELLTKTRFDQIGLKDKLQAAVPDASTVGWRIFKLIPQEDYKLDPIGSQRNNDELDNLARLEWYRRCIESGELSETSAKWQDYLDTQRQVSDFLRRKMEEDMRKMPPMEVPLVDPMTGMPIVDPVTGGPLTQPDPQDPRLVHLTALEQGTVPPDMGTPEIARFIGYTLDTVMPEDFRFDWYVTDPLELRRQCRWMAHRVYMSLADVGAKFQIPKEDWPLVARYGDNGTRLDDQKWKQDPTRRPNLEDGAIDGRAAVWEVWHRERGMVYTIIEGLPYPAAAEPPSVTWHEWYPFFFLWFNRVDGRAIPLSDTCLVRSLQDEINRLRSHDLEARNWALPRLLIKRGSMTPDEMTAYENSYGGQALEIGFPDDIRKAFAEPATLPYNPALYNIAPAVMAMEQMSGITRNAMGTSEGDLATTAAIANEYMGTQMDFRRSQLEKLIADIGTAIMEIDNQIMPESNVRMLVGPGAVWPMVDRQTLFQYIKLEVKPGSSGKPDVQQRREMFQLMPQLAQILGMQVNAQKVWTDFFETFGANNPEEYLLTPEQMMQQQMLLQLGMAPGAGAPAGAGPAMPPPGAPGTPGGAPGPGADPMSERGAPASDEIPNGPVGKLNTGG